MACFYFGRQNSIKTGKCNRQVRNFQLYLVVCNRKAG